MEQPISVGLMERYPIRKPTGAGPGSRRKLPAVAILASFVPAGLLAVGVFSGQCAAQTTAAPPQVRQGRVIQPRVAVPQAAKTARAAAARAPLQPPGQASRRAAPPDEPSQQGLASEPNAPFRLTPSEEAELDRVLHEWEQRSAKVTLFRCDIVRWEYDPVFGKGTNGLKRKAVGELKYRAPDRGLYRVRDEQTGQPLEEWRCDGKAIYEFAYDKKQLIERTLPPELQGKAIANGPLPFVFGAKAETLKKRYYLRLKQPPAGHEEKICIEAYPRFQTDAANFLRAELLLTPDTMMPFALHLVLPNGKSSTDHSFDRIRLNDPIGIVLGDFEAPRTPVFWKRLVDPEEAPPEADAVAPATTITPRTANARAN
jgi:TIGR03009 family protein